MEAAAKALAQLAAEGWVAAASAEAATAAAGLEAAETAERTAVEAAAKELMQALTVAAMAMGRLVLVHGVEEPAAEAARVAAAREAAVKAEVEAGDVAKAECMVAVAAAVERLQALTEAAMAMAMTDEVETAEASAAAADMEAEAEVAVATAGVEKEEKPAAAAEEETGAEPAAADWGVAAQVAAEMVTAAKEEDVLVGCTEVAEAAAAHPTARWADTEATDAKVSVGLEAGVGKQATATVSAAGPEAAAWVAMARVG